MDYAQVLNDVRDIVQTVISQAPWLSSTLSEVGGIELAQEVTRLSKARIYALVSQRGIPHAKRGNKLYFNRADLLAWINNGRRQEEAGPSIYTSKPGRRGRNSAR
ncbi:helix-turn-helix domain-containing protein [Hymenobacter sp. UYCo722]|uniref:helix-turn-helix domain-containing protein n=1 Tax=Hymenobacter sp. UYCo722 TaxID=3156335 RepID=UPI0033965199